MHVNNTERSPQHISTSSLKSANNLTLCLCWSAGIVHFHALFYPNIMYRLHIMVLGNYTLTPRGLLFHPLTSFWEEQLSFPRIYIPKSQLPKAPAAPSAPFHQSAAWQSHPSGPSLRGADETERRAKMLAWDPHMQSLTLIINYGCFCFFLPQPLTTRLLAVREGAGEREEKGDGQREKGQFSSKRISYPNKWDKCAVEPDLQQASWQCCGQMKIYMCLIGRGWVARDN